MIEEEKLKIIAKDIVLHCFRNTHLENIHAGKKNGGVGSGFSDKEMKRLMIEAVNNTYTFLVGLSKDKGLSEATMKWIEMSRSSHQDWGEPKIVRGWLNDVSHL